MGAGRMKKEKNQMVAEQDMRSLLRHLDRELKTRGLRNRQLKERKNRKLFD